MGKWIHRLWTSFPSLDVDRSDIPQKIKNQYFDLIIYGCSYRAKPLLSLVLRHYPRNKIVFIDGDDATTIEKELVFRGMYFKRELEQTTHGIFPIAFAVPDSIIIKEVPQQKDETILHLRLSRQKHHIYKDEESYYHGYSRSVIWRHNQKGRLGCTEAL